MLYIYCASRSRTLYITCKAIPIQSYVARADRPYFCRLQIKMIITLYNSEDEVTCITAFLDIFIMTTFKSDFCK